jgi:hypothetical protein
MSYRWLVGLCALAALAEQPILFPHNRHAALGLDCLDCHSTADTRAAAGMPSVRKCILCHEKLATDKPGVKKVRDYAANQREIPWVRVYRFSPAALVKFRHAPHYRAKIDCTTCHGEMAKATVAEATVKHNMGTCLACHRQKRATQDCIACHY